MSNTQFAFINKDNVPSKEAWQEAIDQFNFKIKLTLDPELSPFEDEGFSPCGWGDTDEDVGFEIYYEPSSDIHEGDEDLIKIIGDKDYCISMCWGGSMKDCAAVMIASAALEKSFGAIISYQGEVPDPADEFLENTKAIIQDALTENERALQAKQEIELTKQAGPASEVILKELKKIEGCEVVGMGVGGQLMIGFSNQSRISAKVFNCRCQSSEVIEVGEYAKLRSQQVALMEGWDGQLTDEQKKEWDNFDSLMDLAGAADEKAYERFSEEVASWPDELFVRTVDMPERDQIDITFSNVEGVCLSFFALDDMLFDMSFDSGNLRFTITDQEVELHD